MNAATELGLSVSTTAKKFIALAKLEKTAFRFQVVYHIS